MKTEACVEWRGYRTQNGYGRQGTKYAHREAYRQHVGPIPDGMVVMHSCDNPACVNPSHLTVGTQADNIQDMVTKGRHAVGPATNRNVLTADEVGLIRTLLSSGDYTQREIAAKFGVAQRTVSAINTRQTWAHVA